MGRNKLFVVMGVSGSGKTTVGRMLGTILEHPFIDGDDLHPQENIKKMASGAPLNDEDRYNWLLKLNETLQNHQQSGVILACSALKEKYRELLRKGLGNTVTFVYLEASYDLVKSRMAQRTEHFMPLELLQSQFETLEPPKGAITVSISFPPEEIVKQIIRQL